MQDAPMSMEYPTYARVKAGIRLAEQRCRAQGTKLTHVRRQVLLYLLTHKRCVGAYEILHALRKDHPNIAPPTVYRPLQFLVSMGLVRHVLSANGYVFSAPDHVQTPDLLMVCSQCAVVVEVVDNNLHNQISGHLAQRGFVPDGCTVEVSTVCQHCRLTEVTAD